MLPKWLAGAIPEGSPVRGAAVVVLRFLRRMGKSALGALVLAFMATVGLMWAAAFVGIQPYAAWLQTGVGALFLFMMAYSLVVAIVYGIYGIFYALRHIGAWPQATHTAIDFLKGNSDGANLLRRAVLPLAAVGFLFAAAHCYYSCHFAGGCWSMRMIAAADRKTIVLGDIGVLMLALTGFVRVGARLKHESEKSNEVFRTWLQERAESWSRKIDAASFGSNHRMLLKTERAEIESVLVHFNQCFPRK